MFQNLREHAVYKKKEGRKEGREHFKTFIAPDQTALPRRDDFIMGAAKQMHFWRAYKVGLEPRCVAMLDVIVDQR